MANEMQRGNLTGTAIMRMPISGTVNISGKQMKELRFMPYSEFPEDGREDVLYIDTDGNAMYYWDGTEYISLSGGGSGGTGDYNELSNKPQINGNVLTGNKTASNLGLQEAISDIDTIRSGAASGSTAVQPATLATALATKQDVISDLASIRSGASKGATAVQPADMEEALSGKQDTISDLQTIRSGAALGATAVQPSDMEIALADKQDVISDLDTIRSGATAGNTALQPEDIDTLPTDGSSNPVSSGGTYDFVNSSIATNTAYFIGTFASVAELEAYSGTVTNNDYAFVTSTDSAGNTLYNRYKYNAATQTWSFEYAVNNTAFTTAQWAAIQSGMTSADKTKLDGIETGANKTVIDASPTSGSDNAVSSGGVHTAMSGKQDTISDLSDIRSGASAGATAVQPSALNDYQTKLSGTNKLDPSFIDYDASHRAVSDTEKSTWNGKQDVISDLSTIRSGAAAGATALQQSDVASTYSASGTAPVNGTAVNAAIGTLDVGSVGGSGKYISAISETDGKIAATPITFDTTLSSSSTNNNAPTSKAVYDDQQRQEVEIGVVANAGAKNFAVPFDPISTTDIIVTRNANGSYTFACTNVSENRVVRVANIGDMPSGTFKISGVTGGSSSTYMLGLYNTSSTAVKYQHTNPEESYTGDVSGFSLRVRIISGYSGTFTVYPMIRPASITDDTFVPYALPNPTLTPAVIKAVDEGAKNLCNWSASTSTIEHVTFTINSDKTVSTSGTATARAQKALTFTVSSALKAGRYALSGCPSGGIQSGTILYCLYIWDNTANTRVCSNDTGGGIEFDWTPDASHTYTIAIDVRSGTNASGLTFKPMICTAADWAVSQKFVPYCPSLPEVYEEVQEIKNVGLVSATVPSATANVLEYTGLSITIPKSSIALVGACDTYNNSKPVGLVLSLNSDPSTTTATPTSYLLYTIEGVSTGQNKVDFVTTIHNTSSSNSMTVYLHAKRATVNSTGNKIILWYHIIS